MLEFGNPRYCKLIHNYRVKAYIIIHWHKTCYVDAVMSDNNIQANVEDKCIDIYAGFSEAARLICLSSDLMKLVDNLDRHCECESRPVSAILVS